MTFLGKIIVRVHKYSLRPGQISRRMPIQRAHARKTSLRLLRRANKNIRSTNLQSSRSNNEKVIVNSKYYFVLFWTPTDFWYFGVYKSDYLLLKIVLSTRGLGSIWLFHVGCPYNIETSPLICSINQWTGFHLIGTSVMKQLITCIRTHQRCNQSPSNIHYDIFDKNS